MRGKGQAVELENLAKGLGSAADPYQIKGLLKRNVEDLAAEVGQRIRYSALEMMTQGRYFLAIKEQLQHGEWETFVKDHKWSPHYVNFCRKLLEVAVKFPHAIHLPPGRVTDKLLQLPMPQIAAVLEEASPETVKSLTPWNLENIWQKNKKPSRPRKVYPDLEVDVSDLDTLTGQAVSALRKIAELKIAAKQAAHAKKYADEIEAAWQHASYNLRDPEHKKQPWFKMDPMHDDVSEDG